jgi:hypothetical protein
MVLLFGASLCGAGDEIRFETLEMQYRWEPPDVWLEYI